MGTTYTRQSSIADGDTITAALFNNEYNQLLNAFSYASSGTTGHQHDGTAAEGGNIHTIGDQDFLNKIVADSTNNRWGIFVEVSSAAVEQIRVQDGAVVPVTDNDIDLGTSSLEFKDGYFDGTVYADAINFNGTAIAATATEINIMDGDTSATSTTLADADRVVVNDAGTMKQVALTDFETYFESSIDTIANFEVTTELQTPLIAFTDGDDAIQIADGGGVTMAAGLTSTAAANSLGATSFNDADITNVGDIQLDSITGDGDTNTSVTFSGSDVITVTTGGETQVTFNNGTILPTTDNDIDLGSSSYEFKDLYIDGTANIDALVADTADINGGSVDGATLGTNSAITQAVIDNVNINGATIGHTDDTDLITLADGVVTVAGELDATTLDISGNADIDGTLEADAYTVDGTSLAEFIADTAGAMVSSNTESGVTVTYQDGDNTIDFSVDAAQTGITSIYATDLILGEDAQTAIDFGTANEIDFKADNAARLTLTSGALYPVTDNEIDLGTSSLEFKDAFFDGTVTSDAFAGPLTGDVTGTSSKVTVSDSTANTNFPVVFHDESDALLDDTGALRYNPSTGELLVPKLTVAGTTTTADTVTMQAANAVIFEGATADAHETTLSIVDPTGDHTQYLINQGGYIPLLAAATTTAITSTPAELNILDGATVVVGEVNALDLGATAVGTAIASKAVILDSNKDYTGVRNFTITGELDGATLDISGDADIDGTTNLDVVDIDGAVDMATTLTLAGNADFNGDLDVDGTTNLDAVDIDGAVQLDSTLTVGVDGTGHDVKFFGDTASAYMLWDQSTDDLILGGAAQLGIGTTTPGHPLHISEAADGTKIQLTRGGVCEWAFSIGNTSTLSGVGAGALEILPLNGGTASEFAVGSAGTTTAILHVKPAAITLAKDTTFSDGADIITASAGTSNFRAGVNAGNSIASGGNYNVVVGDEAGTAITTGDNNVAVGYAALDAVTTADNNTAVGYDSLGANTTGASNVAVGKDALTANTTASNNIAIGVDAATAITTGGSNVAIGTSALQTATTAANNTAIGTSSLAANTTGTANVAVGYATLDANTTGGSNTALGSSALGANTTGSYNTAVGKDALLSATTGESNVCIGYHTGDAITTGGGNTGIGTGSLGANTTAGNNTAVGFEALAANTTGHSGVAVGKDALAANTTGNYNVAVGVDALTANTTGGENTAMGIQAMDTNTTGTGNVAMGTSVLDANTTGDYNVAVGANALGSNTTADANTAVGRNALTANTTGTTNVAVGSTAMAANTTADNNTGIGAASMNANTTGTRNTAVGSDSLKVNTTGNDNTAVGKGALTANTTASNNTAVGKNALAANTTGSENNAFGVSALDSNTTGIENCTFGNGSLAANTTGSNNCGFGDDTLSLNVSGDNNTAVGEKCLQYQTASNNTGVGQFCGAAVSSGEQNTLMGAACHDNLTTGDLNTAYGYNLGPSAVDVDGEVVIGSNITGAGANSVRIGVAAGNATLALDGSDTSWAASSDERLKENIVDSTAGLDFINDLRPVVFNWKKAKDVPEEMSQYQEGSDSPCRGTEYGTRKHGFIAQEIKVAVDKHSEDVMEANGIWREDPDGTQEVAKGNMMPMAIRAIQELSAEVEKLKAQPKCKCQGD